VIYPQVGQTLELLNAAKQRLGTIHLEECKGNLVCGTFQPTDEFSVVEPVFRAFEEAVDNQALSVVDHLDAVIAAMGLRIGTAEHSDSFSVHDVQIWSDGGFSCRLKDSPLVAANGTAVAQSPARLDK
jgi:hypothetical protein